MKYSNYKFIESDTVREKRKERTEKQKKIKP